MSYTVPGRKSDAAYDNFGMKYDAWLDGHRLWPCSNPKCGKKVVDPDSPFQYCSRACFNAVMTNKGGASGQTHYDRAVAKMVAFQNSKYWRNLQANMAQRFAPPPVLTANAGALRPVQRPPVIKQRVNRFTFNGLKQPKGKGRRA